MNYFLSSIGNIHHYIRYYLGMHLMIRKSNSTLAMSGIDVKEFSTMRAATRSLFSALEQRSIATAPPSDLPKTII